MKCKLNSEQIQEIILLYTTTSLDRYDLGKKFNVNPTSIKYWLDKNNIPSKGRFSGKYQKYPFNENFFLDDLNQKTAYFFGFILGDGCLQQNSKKNMYQISIQLHNSDDSILKIFCDWTERSYDAIKYSNTRPHCYIRFNSTNLFKNTDFSKWSLVLNKTYNAVAPIIDLSVVKPFIIGLLDADGSVKFKDHYRIVLINHNNIINWYCETLRKLGYTGNLKISNKKNTCYSTVSINNKQDVINLSKILEINNCDFCLNRKWSDVKKSLAEENYKINNRLKLDFNTVKIIQYEFNFNKTKRSELCNKYKISRQTLKTILNGKYFKQTKYSVNFVQPE